MHWFAAALGVCVALWGLWGVWHGWAARRWPTAEGEIVVARVREHRTRRTRYLPEVQYRYAVGAERLRGSRLRFGAGALHDSERAAAAELRGLQPGARVPVYYDPRKPRTAVLEPGVSGVDLLLLAGGLLFAVVSALF